MSICYYIWQVQQQYKLPSLYLLDSIVKNVGGDYLHLVAQIMEETFTCVFEKVCITVKPCSTDTHLKHTPHYCGQAALSPSKIPLINIDPAFFVCCSLCYKHIVKNKQLFKVENRKRNTLAFCGNWQYLNKIFPHSQLYLI